MSRAKIHLSRSALVHNFRVLSQKVPGQKLIPMVKANAYGHGMIYTAKSLMQEKNLYGYGVATFAEGVELRLALKNSRIPILVFSDAAPWTENHFDLCVQYRLEPVFGEIVSLLTYQKSKRFAEIDAHVEVNTGMNRMGIPVDSLPLIRFQPKTVFTHLAISEDPKAPLTRLQLQNFEGCVEFVRKKYPRALLHFANSGGIWRSKEYKLTSEMNLARPGLSLYGVKPYAKASGPELMRVMRFTAPVLNRVYLEKGDQVGYGGTYVCKKASGEWAAVIAAGYADGVFRSLSNRGFVVHQKKKFQFLGRVSMDLTAIQGNNRLKVGDEVVLWGDEVDPYEHATLAGTVPYEITTRMGERVDRIYE